MDTDKRSEDGRAYKLLAATCLPSFLLTQKPCDLLQGMKIEWCAAGEGLRDAGPRSHILWEHCAYLHILGL